MCLGGIQRRVDKAIQRIDRHIHETKIAWHQGIVHGFLHRVRLVSVSKPWSIFIAFGEMSSLVCSAARVLVHCQVRHQT